MMLSLSAALLSTQLVVTVADRGVPNFDVGPSCRDSTVPDCAGQEKFARDKLVEAWPHFTTQEKARCAVEAKYAGPPSYIGWLTCLQINADTRDIPATIGAGNAGIDPNAGMGGGAGVATHGHHHAGRRIRHQ
jgi:hypothetical protein